MPCTAGQSIPACKLRVFCDGANPQTWHTCPLMHVPCAVADLRQAATYVPSQICDKLQRSLRQCHRCQRIVPENSIREFSCHQCQRKYVQCVLNPVPVAHTHARAHTPHARTHTHAHSRLSRPGHRNQYQEGVRSGAPGSC